MQSLLPVLPPGLLIYYLILDHAWTCREARSIPEKLACSKLQSSYSRIHKVGAKNGTICTTRGFPLILYTVYIYIYIIYIYTYRLLKVKGTCTYAYILIPFIYLSVIHSMRMDVLLQSQLAPLSAQFCSLPYEFSPSTKRLYQVC